VVFPQRIAGIGDSGDRFFRCLPSTAAVGANRLNRHSGSKPSKIAAAVRRTKRDARPVEKYNIQPVRSSKLIEIEPNSFRPRSDRGASVE